MESTAELLEVYGRELAIVRGVKPCTVLAYSKAIRCFVKWMEGRSLLDAKRDDFLRWREVEAPRRKPAGMQLQVAGVRSFYKWIMETQRLPANPCPEMIVHKKPTDPSFPDSQQFLALRDSVQHDLRKSALIELLAGSGLRIDAALALRKDQLVFAGNPDFVQDWRSRPNFAGPSAGQPMKVRDRIRIDPNHCKGYMASYVPVTPCASAAVQRFLAAFPCENDARIFRWSYASAYRVVHDAGRRIGLKICPHSMRHFFGCMMYHRSLDNTERDLCWIRDAMGHSSVAVTNLYLRLAGIVVHHDIDWHEIVWHWTPKAQIRAKSA